MPPRLKGLRLDVLPNEMLFLNRLEGAYQISATFSRRQSLSDHLLGMRSILPLDDDFANVDPRFSSTAYVIAFFSLPPLSELGACRDVVLMTRF
jgi:hypothetical protein